MENIGGFGLVATVIASNTFPNGFQVTQFSDDGDPLDVPEIAVAETAMGLNGDLVVWSKATPLKASMSVIPASDDDQNLAILLEANRVGLGKASAYDVITITVVYPSGNTKTYSPGAILKGMPGSSVSAAGKLKTKKYEFDFENAVGLGS
jgi:hypothetical protein